MKILVAGDYCPKLRVKECLNNADFASILGDVLPYTKSSDFSIVNFESNISNPTDRKIKKHGPNLCTEPRAIEALKWAGFNVVTLANNHIFDFGQEGIERTISILKNNCIEYVGGGHNQKEAGRILYLEKNGETLAIINACEHEFSIADQTQGGANGIDPIDMYESIQSAKNNADYVVVITHGGHELFKLPSLRMKKLFHFFIDIGADAVINHHQHCYSGKEIYNDRPIYYGLGNFIFDYKKRNNNSMVHEGFMVQLDLNKNCISSSEVPYVQCSEKVGIKIIDNTSNFSHDFANLSRIISDSNLLKKQVEQYYENEITSILLQFQPYNNRILNYLFFKGLLPNVYTQNKLFAIRNMIECESHYDKLVFAINKLSTDGVTN